MMGIAEPVIGPATDLGFTRDQQAYMPKSATADLGGRTLGWTYPTGSRVHNPMNLYYMAREPG